jgi:hypothetical protein
MTASSKKLKKLAKTPKNHTKIRFHCPSLSLQPPTGTAVVIIIPLDLEYKILSPQDMFACLSSTQTLAVSDFPPMPL